MRVVNFEKEIAALDVAKLKSLQAKLQKTIHALTFIAITALVLFLVFPLFFVFLYHDLLGSWLAVIPLALLAIFFSSTLFIGSRLLPKVYAVDKLFEEMKRWDEEMDKTD